MTQLQNIPTVTPVQTYQIDDAIDFAMRVRREVFPMLDPTRLPLDFEQFREHYLDSDHAIFLVAMMGIRASSELLGYYHMMDALKS
ncbi:hypothetical protein P9222_18760 [Paenibacillus amylolyticus]|nr:hypothetical protein [Paenibacillus amylolyticus]WFR60624.1 hypothetical protein P9222_18760 [Paenibacillus amylolyticus]